eukprot:gene14703-biopygen14204
MAWAFPVPPGVLLPVDSLSLSLLTDHSAIQMDAFQKFCGSIDTPPMANSMTDGTRRCPQKWYFEFLRQHHRVATCSHSQGWLFEDTIVSVFDDFCSTLEVQIHPNGRFAGILWTHRHPVDCK